MSIRRTFAVVVAVLSMAGLAPVPASAHFTCTVTARMDFSKRVWGFGIMTCSTSESPCVMTVTIEREGLDQATDTHIRGTCSGMSGSTSLECPPLSFYRYRVRVDWFAGDVHGGTVYSGPATYYLCPLI